MSGVTASAAASLIRRAVGATSVGGREVRVTVRGSSMSPLQLAEETLRARKRAV